MTGRDRVKKEETRRNSLPSTVLSRAWFTLTGDIPIGRRRRGEAVLRVRSGVFYSKRGRLRREYW